MHRITDFFFRTRAITAPHNFLSLIAFSNFCPFAKPLTPVQSSIHTSSSGRRTLPSPFPFAFIISYECQFLQAFSPRYIPERSTEFFLLPFSLRLVLSFRALSMLFSNPSVETYSCCLQFLFVSEEIAISFVSKYILLFLCILLSFWTASFYIPSDYGAILSGIC